MEDRDIIVDDIRVRGVGQSDAYKEVSMPEADGTPAPVATVVTKNMWSNYFFWNTFFHQRYFVQVFVRFLYTLKHEAIRFSKWK